VGDGYVYVVGSGRPGEPVKIGWSGDPESRLRSLQTGSAYRLRLMTRYSGPRDLEKFLHDRFSRLRTHGEWFDFGGEDPVALIPEAVGEWDGKSRGRPEVYGFNGPHVVVGVRQGRELASAASGLTDAEFRVMTWYWFATEKSQGAVEQTSVEIAKELGLSPDALRRIIKTLCQARLLVEAGGVGAVKYYRCAPRVAFTGTRKAHHGAVGDWGPPSLQVREPRNWRRVKPDED